MSKTVRNPPSNKNERSLEQEPHLRVISKGAVPGHGLSFISLRDTANVYPDTGESGDTYDTETAGDR